MQKNWFAIFNDHLLNSIVNQKECQLAENPKRKSRPKLKPKPKSRLSKKIKKKTKTNKKAVLARENTKDIRRMIQERRNSVHQSLQNKDEQNVLHIATATFQWKIIREFARKAFIQTAKIIDEYERLFLVMSANTTYI